ncbi:autotransporter outer membrane beta-barrel domain-containing protein [Phascolarctobacterium faecium]|uniref:autotransporter outer membrane beta-barrel domain-containing protein n=1 Tax=Phascolarctobacterium faecium TaxID=33025 RepID=UPI003520EF44
MKERRLSKKKNQQILATLAMGINLVNSMIPLAAALRELPNKSDLQVQQPKREVKTLEYTVLPHTLNFVENMFFGKAEAADYSVDFGVSSGVASMSSGDIMVIKGGTGTVDTMSGGVQYISRGGTGTVSALNGGSQNIYKEGIGAVETVISGYQNIWNGGTGTVNTMSGGQQFISRGSGIVYTMSGGMQNIFSGGTGIVITMNDGSQAIRNSGFGTVSALNGGTQQIYAGGTALDTNIYGGTQLIGGSAVNTTIDGGVAVMLDGNAFVSGLTMSGGEYMLGADGGDYNILGQFEFTGGRLDMTQNKNGAQTDTQEELTIENLDKAGGTFIMDTDLNNEEGDKITIKEAANVGTSYIQVNDTSLLNGTVTDHKNLLLVTDNSGKLTFEGKDLNNGGIWTFTPEIENGLNVKDNAGNVIGSKEEWYLTHIDRSVNNDTQVLLDGSDSSYAMWRNTNDTLRKHLGDLHYRTNKKGVEGIWAHYTGGKFAGSGFDSSYNMYQLGYDKADNAKSTYGFALESGTGHADYSFGSGKDKLFSGSFYGTWTGDDGSYTDVVAKIGQFDTDIKSYGDYPDKASYNNRAYSVSIEYGKTIELSEKSGTFVEPQLQFIAGRLENSEYTTDRGNNVYIGGLNSYIGRVGFVAGQKTKDGNDVYFKASALHEFGGSRDIHMAAANGETLSMSKDYSDTWFEVGIGTNIKLSKASYFYGDIERSFGGEIEKKWQINAGVRFEF